MTRFDTRVTDFDGADTEDTPDPWDAWLNETGSFDALSPEDQDRARRLGLA
jgi:hypothetical protein